MEEDFQGVEERKPHVSSVTGSGMDEKDSSRNVERSTENGERNTELAQVYHHTALQECRHIDYRRYFTCGETAPMQPTSWEK